MFWAISSIAKLKGYHAAAAATAAAVLVLYGFIDVDEFALTVVDADDVNVADDNGNVDTVEEDNEGDVVNDVVVKDDIVFLSELLLLLIEFNKLGILLMNWLNGNKLKLLSILFVDATGWHESSSIILLLFVILLLYNDWKLFNSLWCCSCLCCCNSIELWTLLVLNEVHVKGLARCIILTSTTTSTGQLKMMLIHIYYTIYKNTLHKE